jgi:transcriptional regulator with XRE-family HTH domain
MKKENLLRSPNYWLAYIQTGLYAMIEGYLSKNKLKKKDIADKLGVTKGYISQVLNGDFDHKISKLISLSLACGMVPVISYVEVNKYINGHKLADIANQHLRTVDYFISVNSNEPYSINKKDLGKMGVNILPDKISIEGGTLDSTYYSNFFASKEKV